MQRSTHPLIFKRSTRTDWLMSLNVGTSFMMRSKVGLSQMTAFWALSFTLPLLHFFFLAAPPLGAAAAAFALVCKHRKKASRGGRRRDVGKDKDKDGRDVTSAQGVESGRIEVGVAEERCVVRSKREGTRGDMRERLGQRVVLESIGRKVLVRSTPSARQREGVDETLVCSLSSREMRGRLAHPLAPPSLRLSVHRVLRTLLTPPS